MGEGELLVAIAKIGAVVFVVGSLLSMEMRFTISQLLAPLKNAQLVIAVVIASFVLMPLLMVVTIVHGPRLYTPRHSVLDRIWTAPDPVRA